MRGAENVQSAANDFGNYKRYWDGFDITAQARLRNGLTLQGGTSSGRFVEDICDVRPQVPEFRRSGRVLASPTIPYCRQVEPLLTTFKGLSSYLIPKVDVQVAGTFSSRPGVSLSANQVYTSAQIANPAFSTLGRPLARWRRSPSTWSSRKRCSATESISSTSESASSSDSDGRERLNLDIVNALNSNDNLAYSPTFSATWPTPTSVITARLFRLSAQFDF